MEVGYPHKNSIIYIADIGDDIDDQIAVEYLHLSGCLNGVVLDGTKSSNQIESRIKFLKDRGVQFYDTVPLGTEIIFCGGRLTKVARYIEDGGHLEFLCMNGGFAGKNCVAKKHILEKFKKHTTVRTYNFNMDVSAAMNVIDSLHIDSILLVSKNICHHKKNTFPNLHKELFLEKYKLRETKCLHDLLAVKEGMAFLNKQHMLCQYLPVKVYNKYNEKNETMTEWGAHFNPNSHVLISVGWEIK